MYKRQVQAKQATDLHTPSFTQRIVHEVIKDGFLDRHIPDIRKLYAAQCHAMLHALEHYFPAGVQWTRPEGGMFIWVTLPEHIDASKLVDEAIAEHVAFVPGAPFYANNPARNTLRLSFVTVPQDRIRTGVEILGKLIKSKM